MAKGNVERFYMMWDRGLLGQGKWAVYDRDRLTDEAEEHPEPTAICSSRDSAVLIRDLLNINDVSKK